MRIPIGRIGCGSLLLALAAAALAQKPSSDAAPKVAPGVYATIETSMGTITAELYEKLAPNTVSNFIRLANGTQPWLDPKTHKAVLRPLYDNLIFHRVIPDFMIQTGDPTGTGAHNCGFVLKDEIVPGLRFDRPGRLAMANLGSPNTGACQFFITEAPYPSLNGGYSIFGQVVDGQNVVSKIAHVIRDDKDKPRFPIKLIHVAVRRVVAAPAIDASGGATGFFVDASGDIVTGSRIVQNCIEVRLADGSKLEPAVVDQKNGLALLHSGAKAGASAVFRAGTDVEAEQPVWVARSSNPGAPPASTVPVTATADSHGDNRFLQLAVAEQPDPRGAPVLDTSGNVVGILADPVEGSTPPATLALKASVVMGFLDSAGVKYSAQPSTAPADRAAALENATRYTVQIQCLK
ncbi:MAG: peptidylprolyl isomerase [Acidobacteriia bacterium]|nr:peptidylprolyl isomerase [Terriglobia bacterium]